MMSWDTLFLMPFVSGLLVAATLALVGVLLRLRDEWLAALGFAHLAGASALIGLAVQVPVVIGASVGAIGGAAIKSLGRFRGNTVYALMILGGWSVTLLVAANTTLGSVLGHAMVEGQLYFAGISHLIAALVLVFVTGAGIYWLMPIVIRDRFFPGQDDANRQPVWRWHLGFDLIAALGMAVATATVGLMAAFALVFVPPWLAFRLARHWKQVLMISIGFSMTAYILAFMLALRLDQPFGPILVAVSLLAAGLLGGLKTARA
ncbi:MAG: metal ABC transporter permease [Chromatiales bacterium]|jgi:zinc transport system permease protein